MAIRVLTVDDDEGFTNLLKLNLERNREFKVFEENDPGFALSDALDFKPDVVLLDMVMPGMSGSDVAAQFKSHSSVKNIPIVLLTALLSPQEVGGNGVSTTLGGMVLPKPVDLPTLIKALKEAIKGAT